MKTNPPGMVDVLIGECHINFEKLISKIITYASIEDNKGSIYDETLLKEFTE